MRNLSRASRLYELMTIIAPDVPEEELPGSVDRIAAYITDAGGTVNEALRESPWGRRRLAYPIRYSGRDVRDGFYTVFHFELDPARVDDVERELRLNDRVIRYLVTHYSPVPVEEPEEGEAAEAEAPQGAVDAAEKPQPAAAAPVEGESAAEEAPEEDAAPRAEAASEEPEVAEEAPAETAETEDTPAESAVVVSTTEAEGEGEGEGAEAEPEGEGAEPEADEDGEK